MATNRDMINDVREGLRAYKIDAWTPSAFIYGKLIDVAATFIKREADDRRLFRYTDLFVSISNFEMEETDLVKCGVNIPNCRNVMRSKEKLPKTYTSRSGYLLTIMSLDYDRDYTPITPQQYKYTQEKEFKDPDKRYFWIDNDHVIIPNSLVRNVDVKGMFKNKVEALRLSCDNKDKCIRFLETDFVAPEHLLGDITDATAMKIAGIYLKVSPDELPNMNENEKTNASSGK